jgi:hypothetical protein
MTKVLVKIFSFAVVFLLRTDIRIIRARMISYLLAAKMVSLGGDGFGKAGSLTRGFCEEFGLGAFEGRCGHRMESLVGRRFSFPGLTTLFVHCHGG